MYNPCQAKYQQKIVAATLGFSGQMGTVGADIWRSERDLRGHVLPENPICRTPLHDFIASVEAKIITYTMSRGLGVLQR